MPKHVEVVKDHTDVFVVCAVVWFCKIMFYAQLDFVSVRIQPVKK